MRRQNNQALSTAWWGMGLLALAGLLAFGGCFDNPTSYQDLEADIVTVKTPTALIEPATLKLWMDEGRVNSTDPNSRDKVVVLNVSDQAHFDGGHIPGSLLYNYSSTFEVRMEGVGTSGSMVVDGPNIDALLQRFGIDQYTTIVFTVSDGLDLRQATRGYFTLRYWGFPKNRLKVLQGGEAGWTGTGYSLTTTPTTVAPSDFSVRELASTSKFGCHMRASISEMITAVDGLNDGSRDNIAILDVRSAGDPQRVASMNHAGLDAWNAYYAAGTTATLMPVSDLLGHLAGFGITATTDMTYVYCKSGVKATVVYFILDGILDWPVQMYDGSWNQWSSFTAENGVGAAWKVDSDTPGTTSPRTAGSLTSGTMVLDPVANGLYESLGDWRANQVENEDLEYFSNGDGGATPPSGGGGTGGGGSGC